MKPVNSLTHAVAAHLLLLVSVSAQEPAPTPVPEQATPLTHGPVIGHVDHREVNLWARALEAGVYGARLEAHEGERVWRAEATASPAADNCLSWRFLRLDPGARYRYVVSRDEEVLASGELRVPEDPEHSKRATIAFGSCFNERRVPDSQIWAAIAETGAEAMVFLGDTPYIDTTDLAVQRRRYGEFLAIPGVAQLLSHTSSYGTWDDHDFGRNDTDGRMPGKQSSRQAFVEYHAGDAFGEDGAGIYTSFRRGPVEVFLCDARWFAGTAESPAVAGARTLLGQAQWEWLTRRVAASEASFKLICTGMIWNGATRPGKTDHWGTYSEERDALFAYLDEQEVSGVVLVGGDIHRSRVVEHERQRLDAYPLTELITSPLGNSVIVAANAPHPGLRWDAGLPETFLLVGVDAGAGSGRATLTATSKDATGKVHHELRLEEAELAHR